MDDQDETIQSAQTNNESCVTTSTSTSDTHIRTTLHSKIVDMPNPGRVSQHPQKIQVLLDDPAGFVHQNFVIFKVVLSMYREKTDPKMGDYSLITSTVHTNKGIIEMIYDEGFRGNDALERTAKFLLSSLGLSGLLTRSVIALDTWLSTTMSTATTSQQQQQQQP